MEKLKEAKENLPVAFLTSFVSDGWEKVGILKEEIEAIKKEFKGTKKVEELIQALIDAYLVCIGQMEQHLADKDYLDIDTKEEVKEALKEDVTINIEKVKIIKPEVKVEHENEVEDDIPAVSIPEEEIVVPEAAMIEEPKIEKSAEEKLADIEEACKKESIVEACDWYCDFDDVDPTQPAITDEDLYGKQN